MTLSSVAQSQDDLTSPDLITERWLGALRLHQRGLPQPVAIAMVDAVGRGPLGEYLRKIEDALIHLESADLQEITGSEARVLVAILRQIDDELNQLETRINYLWEKP